MSNCYLTFSFCLFVQIENFFEMVELNKLQLFHQKTGLYFLLDLLQFFSLPYMFDKMTGTMTQFKYSLYLSPKYCGFMTFVRGISTACLLCRTYVSNG